MALITILICAGLILTLLLVSLGSQPKVMNRITGYLFLVSGIAGIILYGYGFFRLYGATAITVLRTVFAVFCMFLGRNEISAISAVPELKAGGIQIIIYLLHLAALYATASAVVTNVGAKLIRTLNLLFLHHKTIRLIYGVSESSVRFAGRLPDRKHAATVFIDSGSGAAFDTEILRMGSIMFSDGNAQNPDVSFLRRIGMKPGKKKLDVYCLDEDSDRNLIYGRRLKEALNEAGIPAEQCRITLLGNEEVCGELMPGFSSVSALNREELAARLMVREYPPYRTMKFTEDGDAQDDFEVLIVGFGRTGQAVLRQLVKSGQFAGSQFRAAVIARDYSQASGSFSGRYPGLMQAYQIDFLEENARGLNVYQYLEEHSGRLKYIAVCTGNEKENMEIAREYDAFLHQHGCSAEVIQCSAEGITVFSKNDGTPQTLDPYTPEILDGSELDLMAKILNHQYHREENHSMEEDWAGCDYFSRMSCRAASDFMEAFMAVSGISAETLKEQGWPEDRNELMEHLAETEHLRWCGFHYASGYQTMSRETFRERVLQKYARAGKDPEKKLHICLVPWEELPEIDRMEKELTGREVNYQEMDYDNVRMIPEMLREKERYEENRK
ncbi:MAG: hypothetical protein E7190_09160 [Erysipelotrichaceae bacterium]|nr:hypothetical protein [Erysipelotrichaceae bacterium]